MINPAADRVSRTQRTVHRALLGPRSLVSAPRDSHYGAVDHSARAVQGTGAGFVW